MSVVLRGSFLVYPEVKINKQKGMVISMTGITDWFSRSLADFGAKLQMVFVEEDRYQQMIRGFLNTLQITAGALGVGIIIGIVVAAIRSSYDKNKESLKLRGGVGYHILRILNLICRFYLTVIRGTPVVVQLMIAYLIIFASSKNGVPVAIFAFGVNSGAYAAEIFRGGIMSIDGGQFEAGRSLGFNYLQTMWHIIIPQMFKAVLPTLCNEFIALLKETSVAGYVGVVDLTKAGNIIAGRTFNYFIPLFTVALVYLTLVVILSWLVGRLERRLRRSER